MRGRGKTVEKIQRLSMKILIGAFLGCALLAGLQLLVLTRVDAALKMQQASLIDRQAAVVR
ncbi:hypothetical protein [Rhizobium sp. SL86]|jgi:hypothetical protein|uniref:hypothetical protein n=1 Tax=Rhizobium sp. SL86 TaxID=2995148 RepID=UPI0022733569|nr:hypothetical protein [Rhizobium sp. SL86]MCY1669297.1 hypothetical protein [Rhizobium sp. SL86]